MVEVMKIMETSFKRSPAPTAALGASDSEASHQQHTPLSETPGHSWACLSQSPVGSLLLSPGSWSTQVLFPPSKSQFPQSYVISGGPMVELMVTSSKRAYAIPRSAAPEPLRQATVDPHLHRRHSDIVLAHSL